MTSRVPGALLARIAGLVLGLAACHSADAPPPAAPKSPPACDRASDSIVAAMLARLPAGNPPPTDEADAVRRLIRERCERDGWSAEATQCLIAMKRLDDAEPCARLLSDDQQAALARDGEAKLGHGGAAAPAGSAGPGTSPAPPASRLGKPPGP